MTGIAYTKDLLEKLGHVRAAQTISDFLEETVRERLSPHELLNRVLEAELEAKEERKIATNLRFSGLPLDKTIENFDFSFQPSVDRNRISTLATCEFIVRKENVLIFGPPGVGKTHLAASLGLKAVKNGFSVTFLTLDQLIVRLKKDEEFPHNRLAKRHVKANLLIIDEVGYCSLNSKEANMFFGLISQRYENSSTIITSNKSVREWPQVLGGDETLTSAILDRLLHHAYSITIGGRSYRLKDKEAMFKEE